MLTTGQRFVATGWPQTVQDHGRQIALSELTALILCLTHFTSTFGWQSLITNHQPPTAASHHHSLDSDLLLVRELELLSASPHILDGAAPCTARHGTAQGTAAQNTAQHSSYKRACTQAHTRTSSMVQHPAQHSTKHSTAFFTRVNTDTTNSRTHPENTCTRSLAGTLDKQ